MKLINTEWEKMNLNIDSCEIIFDDKDALMVEDDIVKLINDNIKNNYEYIVLKTNIVTAHLFNVLQLLNFRYAENQFLLKLNKNDFYKSYAYKKFDSNEYSYMQINKTSMLDLVISEIRKGVFKTDRIAYDSCFGIDISNIRYSNWAKQILKSDHAKGYIIYKNSVPIGFEIGKKRENFFDIMLSGVFVNYQKKGVGNYWQRAFLNMIFNEYETVYTTVSSNNLAIIKVRQKANFVIEKISTVYVKHSF